MNAKEVLKLWRWYVWQSGEEGDARPTLAFHESGERPVHVASHIGFGGEWREYVPGTAAADGEALARAYAYIDASPCDPDMTSEQWTAYRAMMRDRPHTPQASHETSAMDKCRNCGLDLRDSIHVPATSREEDAKPRPTPSPGMRRTDSIDAQPADQFERHRSAAWRDHLDDEGRPTTGPARASHPGCPHCFGPLDGKKGVAQYECPWCLARYLDSAAEPAEGYMTTFSGVQFRYGDPTPNMVRLEDIAHALSNLCHWGGHSREFFSVAQHSLLVAELCPPELKPWAILHDAAEAYCGDMIRPIKVLLPEYRAIEHRVLRAVAERFGLPWPEPPELKLYDNRALQVEAAALMHVGALHDGYGTALDLGDFDVPDFTPMSPREAEAAFLAAALSTLRTAPSGEVAP